MNSFVLLLNRQISWLEKKVNSIHIIIQRLAMQPLSKQVFVCSLDTLNVLPLLNYESLIQNIFKTSVLTISKKRDCRVTIFFIEVFCLNYICLICFREKFTTDGIKKSVEWLLLHFKACVILILRLTLLKGNYSFIRICNFLVCERQILRRIDLLL